MDPGPLFQLGRVLIGFGILLVVAGATVEPEWLESEQVRADPAMLAALQIKPT